MSLSSSASSSIKYDKTNLAIYLRQKRLRHVYIISGSNLKIDSNKFKIWYTLHKDRQTNAFYISEKRENDKSPKWLPINQSRILDRQNNLVNKSFIIRVWYKDLDEKSDRKSSSDDHSLNNKLVLLIEMNVHLSGLIKLTNEVDYSPIDNLLLFEMFNYQFCEPTKTIMNALQSRNSQSFQIRVKNSYQIGLLMRIYEFEKVINDTKQSRSKLKQQILQLLDNQTNIRQLKVEIEVKKQNIETLNKQLLINKCTNKYLFDRNKYLNDRLVAYKRQIDEKKASIERKKDKIERICAENAHKLNELIKLKEKLAQKQKEHIHDLAKIYPIECFRPKSNTPIQPTSLFQSKSVTSQDIFKIANVQLPNANLYLNQDEQQLSVAIGYVCHCLLILCNILNIPLRYPIIYRASKSIIIDNLNEFDVTATGINLTLANGANINNIQILNSDQELQLYRTNSVQEHCFSYAVFLLNKNIAQLRILFDNYKNIDLNNTLGNLYWMFNHI